VCWCDHVLCSITVRQLSDLFCKVCGLEVSHMHILRGGKNPNEVTPVPNAVCV
jgi:hypothetical protein